MRFEILDVFAKDKYAGNQLAVFIAPEDLPADEMQRIAREINFSESSFILGVDETRNEATVRIFTPRAEVDFAGHPVIGTAYLLRKLTGTTQGEMRLNLKVGKVTVTYTDDPAASCWVQTIEPEFGQTLPVPEMAAVLRLGKDSIVAGLPIEVVSTGFPHFIVPLTGREALAACDVDLAAYHEIVRRTAVTNILVFAEDPHEQGQDYSVRMFAGALGIPEDPATGSGNSCLAAYLMKYVKTSHDKFQFRTGQGYEMGRPSELHLRAERHSSGFHIHLGGNVVEVAAGDWQRM
jgi:trans-2,3-dihydro-3-hydroxyanthranilate isomerase